jgi:hypothetical protein
VPEINPGSRARYPADWRTVYDTYSRLIKLAAKAGENANYWRLETKGKVFKQWRLSYTYRGQVLEIFLGTNGVQAAKTLETLIKTFQYEVKLKAIEEKQKKDRTTAPKTKLNPVFNPTIVANVFEKWNEIISRIRSTKDWETFSKTEDGKYILWFMNKKAGYLDMTMQDYLTKFGMSKYWKSPPRDEQEYNARLRELQRITDQQGKGLERYS